MSDYRYRHGNERVLVVDGQPEQPVQIGVGQTWAEARASLESTPIQSAGPANGPMAARHVALRWARGAGWIDWLPGQAEYDAEVRS